MLRMQCLFSVRIIVLVHGEQMHDYLVRKVAFRELGRG